MSNNERYTEQMENVSYQYWDDDDDDIGEKVKHLLVSDEVFLTFTQRLRRFLALQVFCKDEDKINEKNLLERCTAKGISFNRTTMHNWLSGEHMPKKGEQARESLFALAFALDLPLEQVELLFHKVYLDRAFNLRNPHEFIYHYCFERRYDWQHAQKLIDELPTEFGPETDQTIATCFIASEERKLDDDAELLRYIAQYPHNFSISNTAAKQCRDELIRQVKGTGRKPGLLAMELDHYPERKEDYAGRKLDSNDVMLDMIFGVQVSRSVKDSGIAGTELPREIKNCFPSLKSFTQDASFETLRKLIILLFSYCFWSQSEYCAHSTGKDNTFTLEDYIAELNDRLQRSSLAPLYYGDPYDWLFLYCTLFEHPLDYFRDIMQEIYPE